MRNDTETFTQLGNSLTGKLYGFGVETNEYKYWNSNKT